MNAPTKMTGKQFTGYDRLHNSRLNKGTAFTEDEPICETVWKRPLRSIFQESHSGFPG